MYLDVVVPSENVLGLRAKKALLGKMFFHVEVCDILTTRLQSTARLQVLTFQSTPTGNKISILFLAGFSTRKSQWKIYSIE